jgi:hypothetical protein
MLIKFVICFEYEINNGKNEDKIVNLINIKRNLDFALMNIENLKQNFDEINTIVQSNRKNMLLIESQLSRMKKDYEKNLEEQKNFQVNTYIFLFLLILWINQN